MKKFLAILSVAVMSFSLVACGGPTNDKNKPQTNESGSQQETEVNNTTQKETENTDEKNEFKRETTEDGYIVISKKEFASYITKVELTTENWKEYIDITEITEEERNGFGEIEKSNTFTGCTFKNVAACYFDDVAIDFKITETGESLYCEGRFAEIVVPNDYNFAWENYSIDDFTCEKIIGNLIIVKEFPNECLSSYEDGGKFLCVGSADDYMIMNLNDTKDMSMNISLAYAMYN